LAVLAGLDIEPNDIAVGTDPLSRSSGGGDEPRHAAQELLQGLRDRLETGLPHAASPTFCSLTLHDTDLG
jgi:hypothetical protein